MHKDKDSSSTIGIRDTVTVVSAHCKTLISISARSTNFTKPLYTTVCGVDSDVTVRSADDVHFHLHRKNLEINTGAFPPSELETRGEVVRLSENAQVLELLFQFIYPMHHPSLAATPFETLLALAEAAEKYEVYSAMNMCQVRMQ